MKESKHKLIRIFFSLQKEEQKSFYKYITQSHGSHADIYKLVDLLYRNRIKLDEEKFWKELNSVQFPKLSSKNLSNLMSKTNSKLEEWMITYDLVKSKYDKQLATIKAYNKRGLYSEANRIASNLESKISSEQRHDLNKSRALYLLKDYQYYTDNPIKYAEGIKALEELISNFNNYYKELTHIYNTELYNWGRIQKHDFSSTIRVNNQRSMSINPTELSDLTASLEKLMAEYDLDEFNKISNLLLSDQIYPDTILHTLCCEYSIYCCSQLLRNNVLKKFERLIQLYEYGLKTGALLLEGKLSVRRFHNIINSIAQVSTYKKVDNFIEKWSPVVISKNIQTIKNIAKAQNCFQHEKYSEIPEYIRSIKFETQFQKFRVIKYELIALYETDNFELFNSTLNNYQRMIKRNKSGLSEYNYHINLNFIKVLNYIKNGDTAAATFLLESNEPLIFRKWLRQKIG